MDYEDFNCIQYPSDDFGFEAVNYGYDYDPDFDDFDYLQDLYLGEDEFEVEDDSWFYEIDEEVEQRSNWADGLITSVSTPSVIAFSRW